MNERSDADRLLRYWMEDGPATMPDRVVDVVADRIRRVPQRHAWPFRRRSTVTTQIKLVAALAAAIVVAVVGYNVLPRQPSTGGVPISSPSPTAAPTNSVVASVFPFICDDPAFECAGELTAGTHSSTAFRPALTFTVPAGWANTLDRDRAYNFRPPGGVFSFQVISQVAIAEQNAECTAQRKAGVGNTVADWVQFLTTHPGLEGSTPTPVTVGGYEGFSITFHVNSTWTAMCPGSLGPAVVLVTDSGTAPTRQGFIDDQYTTNIILDVAGETVVIGLGSAPSAVAHEADKARVQPVIDSFKFSPGT